jgi:transcriptional regulator GlxA family with amidase domain
MPEQRVHPAFEYYSRLRKVREYAEKHLADDLSLDTAARVAGMDKKYFSRFFYAKTGCHYRDWVASLRVRRAMDMIQTADHSIARVAFAVGFGDIRTFERAFKKHTGKTARAYKRSVQPTGGEPMH